MLLLVVLSLLVLFTLIAITFVLVAGSKLRQTKNELRVEQYGDDPRDLCDEALARAVRGTTDRSSTIRLHDLLGDLYGDDGAGGSVQGVFPVGTTFGQLIDLTCGNVKATYTFEDFSLGPTDVVREFQLQTPGHYNGCVLTMIDGPAAGLSTRIVGWGFYDHTNPSTGTNETYVARVTAFPGGVRPDPNNRFIVNGRPFNGTGFGYNPTSTSGTMLNAEALGTPYTAYQALLPDPTKLIDNANHYYLEFGGVGGPDEDYDVADPQNMALAYLPVQVPSQLPPPNFRPLPMNTPPAIIPSFHRPELFAYFMKKQGITNGWDWKTLNSQVLDAISLRPSAPDSPDFTGSNPQYHPVYGPFDVDNDGDGIRESVWIDVGLPVQTGTDGRRYKPLVAFLITDLDGRLNVNAHGSTAHVDNYYLGTPPTVLGTRYFNGINPALIPRGEGYGPPEINLYPLFQGLGTPYATTGTPLTYYAQLLAARYAEPNTSLTTTAYDTSLVIAGNPITSPLPGITNFDDLVSGIRFNAYPERTDPAMPTAFSAPHDLLGKGFRAHDVRGMPVNFYLGQQTAANQLFDTIDDPYELNLSRRGIRSATTPALQPTSTTVNPIDSPFSPGELERLLRMYDADAGELPDRLRTLLDPSTTSGLAWRIVRNMITTDSFDLPSPAMLPTAELRSMARSLDVNTTLLPPPLPLVSPNLVDLLRLRLMKGMNLKFPLATKAERDAIDAQVVRLLPPELVSGLRMDVNRPFGNGRDDDTDPAAPGYEIVDEPGEVESAYWLPGASAPGDFAGIVPNYTNGQSVDLDLSADPAQARQLYARHLFVLLMLLKDEAAIVDFNDDTSDDSAAETIQGLAQIAVNIVDFRDRDAIMTPFEYDTNPWNGWDVDGDLTTTGDADRGVVWGCERPEVIITELIAFHDRRSEDLEDDTFVTPPPPHRVADGDPHFDQRIPPRGSFFVELHNPWVTEKSLNNTLPMNTSSEVPGEFYDVDQATNGAVGIQLNRGAPGGAPVFRMLVATVDDTDDTLNPPAVGQLERAVYFRNPGVPLDGVQQHYPSAAGMPALYPGRYLVVGSPGDSVAGGYVTTIGRQQNMAPGTPDTAQDGAAGIPGTRQIRLAPSIGNANQAGQVQVLNNDKVEPNAVDVLPPLALVVDQPTPLNISEPLAGYPAINPADPTDEPLDESNLLANPSHVRFLHLQRLADPTRAWHAQQNPYLTIDSTQIPLVVFNGVAGLTDPSIDDPPYRANNGMKTLERGIHQAPNGSSWVFWQSPGGAIDTDSPVSTSGTAHNFQFQFLHTLGYLNTTFGTAGDINTAWTSADPNLPAQGYLGSAKKPLSWLQWNDRPYVSPLDLLMVPRGRSSLMLRQYNFQPSSGFAFSSTTSGRAGGNHLLGFPRGTGASLHLERLLELLSVPSRFVGTQMELNPNGTVNPQFGTASPGALPSIDPAEHRLISFFHAPFNQVSNYRDPGRVNINTIPSDTAPGVPMPNDTGAESSIWRGIVNSPGTPNPTWQQVFQSRQGGPTWTADSPTRFGNPFRSANGRTLMLPDTPGAANLGQRFEVDVTMMRGVTPFPSTPVNGSLFYYNAQAGGNADDPAADVYFRDRNLRRTSNLLTTRSNVYAIWLTVGYFEANGVRIGQERGADTGEVKRHRAFYIYDRSIPVGYERGKDHNFRDGLLLKRFIE